MNSPQRIQVRWQKRDGVEATHQMLYVSAIATDRRREAALDLWRNIRSPLVARDSEDIRRRA
tara:strand:- start:154 stop:339 length:186 start_codon:yes stop_codon:yes gene_type:complete